MSSFFQKSTDWKLIAEVQKPKPEVLQRLVFQHASKDVRLVADAYRGREIRKCTNDFFAFAAGNNPESISVQAGARNLRLQIGGGADLIAYVGHDGLMDFSLASYPKRSDEKQRDLVILACASKNYFARPLRESGAYPLLWTTGLLAPEAYVLKAAIDGWVLNEKGESVRKRAAVAYNQYQKCGSNAALRLFSSGW